MSDLYHARVRAAIVVIAPLVLLAGSAWHPYVANEMDAAAVQAGLAQESRWIWSHIVLAFGFGLTVAAIHGAVNYLHENGERSWSSLAMLLGAVGGVGYGFLVGTEGLGARLAVDAGADVSALIERYEAWLGIFFAFAILFSLAVASLAVSVWRSHALHTTELRLAELGLAGVAVLALVPAGWAGIAASAAAVVGFWPIAYEMWRHPAPQMAMGMSRSPA